MKNFNKILIIRFSSIGDIVLAQSRVSIGLILLPLFLTKKPEIEFINLTSELRACLNSVSKYVRSSLIGALIVSNSFIYSLKLTYYSPPKPLLRFTIQETPILNS